MKNNLEAHHQNLVSEEFASVFANTLAESTELSLLASVSDQAPDYEFDKKFEGIIEEHTEEFIQFIKSILNFHEANSYVANMKLEEESHEDILLMQNRFLPEDMKTEMIQKNKKLREQEHTKYQDFLNRSLLLFLYETRERIKISLTDEIIMSSLDEETPREKNLLGSPYLKAKEAVEDALLQAGYFAFGEGAILDENLHTTLRHALKQEKNTLPSLQETLRNKILFAFTYSFQNLSQGGSSPNQEELTIEEEFRLSWQTSEEREEKKRIENIVN
jgi:hypothetical protein